MANETSLAGKVAILSGGSRGIGAAAAIEMAKRGAAVMVAARKAESCAETVAAIRALGGKADAASCEVTDYAACAATVAATERAFGPVDIIVANAAAIDPVARIADSDPAEWARHIDINLTGIYNIVRAVLPAMIARNSGTIIAMSTGAATSARNGISPYCTSKAGALMLHNCLDLELRDTGIDCFAFAPGMVDTHMHVRMRAEQINELSFVPREKLQPVEAPANIIAWLASPDARAWRGQFIMFNDQEVRQRAGIGDLAAPPTPGAGPQPAR